MKVKELSDLVSIRTLQKIQEYYCTALGFTLSINKVNGEFILKPSKFSKLWGFVQKKPEIDKIVYQNLLNAFERSEKSGQIVIFERLPETSSFVSPIAINGKIYGYFVGGMVRHGNPNMEQTMKLSEQLGVDLDEYLDAFLSLPLISIEKLEAAANLIKLIGVTISSLEHTGNDLKLKSEEAIKQNRELFKSLEFASTQLDHSENKYKTILSNIYDGAYLEDLNGNIIDINSEGAKLLGYAKPEEVIGKNFKNLYAISTDLYKYTKLISENGHIKNWIAQIVTPEGEERYLETNVVAIKDNNNKIIRIQGVFRDVNSIVQSV